MRSLTLFALLALLATGAAARADKIAHVAGGDGPDGTEAAKAKLVSPFGVDFWKPGTADETILIAEMVNGDRVRAITPDGKLITVAGAEGKKGFAGNGGPAKAALFNGIHSLAVGPAGAYLADTWNNSVRLYEPTSGKLLAFAGTGAKGFTGDGGPAKDARFSGIHCVGFNAGHKALYLTDLGNRRIRKVDVATGTVSTVAGNGMKGVPKDGAAAVTQPLVDPRAHAVDPAGNLWILERGGHALRVVDPKGAIRTAAGTGKPGMGTGPALAAAMDGPKHLSIDRDGTVLIADTENHRVVRYRPREGTLTTVAGTGKRGKSLGGGDPLKAELNQPHGVIVHPKTGDIYIADSGNDRVLKIVRE